MPFFVSKALLGQYEARIDDLKKQIVDLRSLALPISQPLSIPHVALEADAILTGREETYPDEPNEEAEAMLSEAARVLSGNY